MKIIRIIFLGIFALALTACGGSSSSSGGGGGAIVYTGTLNATASAPGVPPVTESGPITITVSGGQVTIFDGTNTATAPLSADGKNYKVPQPLTIPVTGGSCSGSIVYTGTITGSTTSGTAAGSTLCSASGLTFTITLSGNFSATQSSVTKSLSGNGLSGVVESIVNRSL